MLQINYHQNFKCSLHWHGYPKKKTQKQQHCYYTHNCEQQKCNSSNTSFRTAIAIVLNNIFFTFFTYVHTYIHTCILLYFYDNLNFLLIFVLWLNVEFAYLSSSSFLWTQKLQKYTHMLLWRWQLKVLEYGVKSKT